MLKIWGRLTSVNVQKVMLAVRDLALPHTFIEAGGPFGVVDTPEYAKINPNRTVPAIDDGGFVLWESNAIVRYLAARYGAGTLWPEDVCLRADADRWMDWQTTEWQGAMGPAFLGLIRTPEAKRDPAAIELSVKRSNDRARILDQALQGREFIAGRIITRRYHADSAGAAGGVDVAVGIRASLPAGFKPGPEAAHRHRDLDVQHGGAEQPSQSPASQCCPRQYRLGLGIIQTAPTYPRKRWANEDQAQDRHEIGHVHAYQNKPPSEPRRAVERGDRQVFDKLFVLNVSYGDQNDPQHQRQP